MAIIIKSLADNQLIATTSAPDSLEYEPPGTPVARTAVVRNIRLANADDTNPPTIPATVLVECEAEDGARDSSGSKALRKLGPVNLVIPPNGRVLLDEEITLDTSDKLKVTLLQPASGTAKLDVVISGIEREF